MKKHITRMLNGIAAVAISGSLTATLHAEIVTEEISYEGDGITMKGYLAHDDSTAEKRPGILVVHEWWGHNAYARKRAEQLAQLGYTALAVDMYGDGKTAEHPDQAGEFSQAVFNNIEGAKTRFMAALKTLKAQESVDSERIAAIGYCFGGGVVLHMARFGADLDGVVSFHGSLATQNPAQPGEVKARILVCHGGDDEFIPQEQVLAFMQEMQAANAQFKVITYPGAKHSFTNPDADAFGKKFELPLAYDTKADRQSWADMQAFFKEIFAPAPATETHSEE